MTAEQFKATFKVGDKVRLSNWGKTHCCEITALGRMKFLGIAKWDNETDWHYENDNDWLPYTEKKTVRFAPYLLKYPNQNAFMTDEFFTDEKSLRDEYKSSKYIIIKRVTELEVEVTNG